jgi:hypothetical protein
MNLLSNDIQCFMISSVHHPFFDRFRFLSTIIGLTYLQDLTDCFGSLSQINGLFISCNHFSLHLSVDHHPHDITPVVFLVTPS